MKSDERWLDDSDYLARTGAEFVLHHSEKMIMKKLFDFKLIITFVSFIEHLLYSIA